MRACEIKQHTVSQLLKTTVVLFFLSARCARQSKCLFCWKKFIALLMKSPFVEAFSKVRESNVYHGSLLAAHFITAYVFFLSFSGNNWGLLCCRNRIARGATQACSYHGSLRYRVSLQIQSYHQRSDSPPGTRNGGFEVAYRVA